MRPCRSADPELDVGVVSHELEETVGPVVISDDAEFEHAPLDRVVRYERIACHGLLGRGGHTGAETNRR